MTRSLAIIAGLAGVAAVVALMLADPALTGLALSFVAACVLR